jgi:8-oxo-dGTP pyrophosphatase MutT (NUDIX family)
MPVSWAHIGSALAGHNPAPAPPGVPDRAAVAVILREGAHGIEILFIRRAEHPQDPWSGQMAFPGGRREAQDADLRETARRETAEEIGVDLGASAELLGRLDEVRAMARMQPLSLVIAPYVFRLTQPAQVRLSDEVRSVHWLPLDELLHARTRSTMDYVHEARTLQFPCLRFDEIVVWGLTYRMFMSLAALLERGSQR